MAPGQDPLTANITSAAIGAIVASIVTGFVSVFAAWRERKQRRQELIFKSAIDMAIERRKTILAIAEQEGRPLALLDDIDIAAVYYKLLSHLFDKGDLPEAHKKAVEKDKAAADRKLGGK